MIINISIMLSLFSLTLSLLSFSSPLSLLLSLLLFLLLLLLLLLHCYYTLRVEVRGVFWIHPVCLSVCHPVCLSVCHPVCPSVRPSVRLSFRPSFRLSHLFHYAPIIVSSWNFQELLPMTMVRLMQKVKVRGQRSRSQRSQPNLAVSGL